MSTIADEIRRITAGAENRLNPEIDPAATRSIADEIAVAVRGLDLGIDAVASWAGPGNAMIAFAVAEALGVPAVQLAEDEGLLYFSWAMPASRVVLVAAAAETSRQIDVAAQALAGAGHTHLAVAQLVSADGDRNGSLTVRATDAAQ